MFIFVVHCCVTMTINEFKGTLNDQAPPKQINLFLQSLWYDKKGDWEHAHNIAQEIHSKNGSWIHAYLHRKEGDISNASYWYHMADKPMPNASLDTEWEDLVTFFTNKK